MRPAPY